MRETTPRGLLPPDPKTDPKNEAVHLSGARSDAEPGSQTEPSAETSARLAEFDTKVASRLRRCETWTSHADADAFASAFCFGAGPAARRLVAEAFVAAVESASLASESDTATTPTALLARALATLAGASAVFDAEIKDFVVDATRASTEKHYWDVTRAETSKKEERNRHLASVSSRETEKRHLGSVRFMGELVKFRALDPEWAFDFLKKGVDAFAGRALDAACALLQTCGRYLARRRDTARRTDALLDVFLRRKAVSAARLEPGQSELVDATVRAARRARRGGAPQAEPPPDARVRRVRGRPSLPRVVLPPPGVACRRRAARMSRMSRRTRKARPRPRAGDDAVPVRRQLRKVRWAEHAGRVAPPERRDAFRPGGERGGRGARWRRWTGSARTPRDVRGRASRRRRFCRNRRREKKSAVRAARVALGQALGEAFVARLVPATAMFAQFYALLVEENRTTQRTADGGSGPNGPEPGARRVFRKTRPRPAARAARRALVWRRTFSFRRFRKRHEKRGRERKRKG